MKTSVLLLVFLIHFVFPEKHSLKFFSAGFSGMPNFPDYSAALELDGIEAAYCDSNKTLKIKQDWVKTILQTNPDHVDWYKIECFEIQPTFFKDRIHNLTQRFNQSEGVHILQRISGCEWDNETGEVESFMKYGYDGEDLISFDMKNQTWIALKPKGGAVKSSWDADNDRIEYFQKYFLTDVCPRWLKKYVEVARSSLLRKVLPSVSFLQKSPSSPVTCHATGFYADRAAMFWIWREDGNLLIEDGEYDDILPSYEDILPNHDGSFQMSLDLNKSSISSKDWGRFGCVLHLWGVKEKIVTKLHKDVIRTNHGDSSVITITISIVIAAVCCLLLAGAAYKYHRAPGSESSPETSSELSERLRADG